MPATHVLTTRNKQQTMTQSPPTLRQSLARLRNAALPAAPPPPLPAGRTATVECSALPTATALDAGDDSGAADSALSQLRLLSFNIQVGITTGRYHHYFTRGWKHLLPHSAGVRNLQQIADLVSGYDLVALQEVDGGSLRSGFINQVEYVAHRARFPYWYAQLNRDLGPFAQHGNGLLSRIVPTLLEDHKLPGTIPGRGAIVMRLPLGDSDVLVVFLHLSLGPRSRRRQLSYVRELIQGHDRVVLIGDMNSHMTRLLFNSPLADTGLMPADNVQPTYPSWCPAIALDHVLATPSLQISNYEVLDCLVSDHRPIAVDIGLARAPATTSTASCITA